MVWDYNPTKRLGKGLVSSCERRKEAMAMSCLLRPAVVVVVRAQPAIMLNYTKVAAPTPSTAKK